LGFYIEMAFLFSFCYCAFFFGTVLSFLALCFLFWHCPKKMLVRPLAENKKSLALDYTFFFGIAPKKKQKNSSARKIKLPTFSLLLKFPKLVVVPPPQTAGNFNATASCECPV
jgi:hypothetical protein